ncbi:MAG TPA: RnfABCDGE type electron transport complex subunit D [Spirochaetota bacterium]|nr:RnfABCDGE type electron transport complex subunit D [Spirochaetota bacterium]HPI88110.1 RnfABCDGE type electron transport complex subunit D [Spirochaetota bacterium]HPR46405.1 RnfABCDGE type electron transport complex subunit D [Spirochaetota bacterium]
MTENKEPKALFLSNAPHISTPDSVTKIMWLVVASLVPAAVFSIYTFGVRALILLLVSTVSAMAAEALFQLVMGKKITVKDGSAAITGLLIGMNVPPAAPVWMLVIGSFFGIIIVKQLFGGLGFNIFNPALAARAFMMASWPVHMTTGWHSFSGNIIGKGITNTSGLPQQAFDAVSQATPLGALKEGPKLLADMNIGAGQLHDLLFSPAMFKSLAIGNVGGVIGETSAVCLLAGGIFLLARRIITWHIPVSYIATVGILAFAYYALTGHASPCSAMVFHLLSGGLMLGAFFMATDMVTSPVSAKGMIVFGAGCGIITFVIRMWGGYPEGVSYSILLMNATVPLIDRFTKPAVFGK